MVFRNALVRANYNNFKIGIHETTEYLELFLRNLLLNEENELHNRVMHISGKFCEFLQKRTMRSIKANIEMQKVNDKSIKANIRKQNWKNNSWIIKIKQWTIFCVYMKHTEQQKRLEEKI